MNHTLGRTSLVTKINAANLYFWCRRVPGLFLGKEKECGKVICIVILKI